MSKPYYKKFHFFSLKIDTRPTTTTREPLLHRHASILSVLEFKRLTIVLPLLFSTLFLPFF
ncbi:hypothetical protein Hanom_Chr07g00619591 [Helianthus anomalus]